MTAPKMALALRRRYGVLGADGLSPKETQAQLNVITDRLMDELTKREEDGLTTDSTVSLDLGAMDLTVELLVLIGDPSVAIEFGGRRMTEALQAVGQQVVDVQEENAQPVKLVSA